MKSYKLKIRRAVCFVLGHQKSPVPMAVEGQPTGLDQCLRCKRLFIAGSKDEVGFELHLFELPLAARVPMWKIRFRRFLHDEFGRPPKGQTYRWLFCWNGEQDNEPPFDCACCLSAYDGFFCECICHSRIKQLEDFIESELSDKL